MSLKEFVDKVRDEPSSNDPVPSKRAVISERAIFAERCPRCNRTSGKPCREPDGTIYISDIPSTEFAFHPERIYAAIRTRITETMVGNLTANDRMLICYYAFILQCDSMAANSLLLFKTQQTSQSIQAFFCQCAITELKRDKLL